MKALRFVLDYKKAAQAAAFLLKCHHGSLNYLVLIKLLYIADKQAFLESSLPITGDFMVSMKKGPVLSGIYDLIKGEKRNRDWSRYVSEPQKYAVFLRIDKPENDLLSPYELRILETVDRNFGHLTWSQISDLTHLSELFPEWRKTDTSVPIEPAEILRLDHRSEKEIDEIAADVQEYFLLKTLS